MLVAALAAYVMVKFYGVIFLGQPREAEAARRARRRVRASASASSGSRRLRAARAVAGAVSSIVLDRVNAVLIGAASARPSRATWWLLLAPISADRASYMPAGLPAVVVAGRRAADAAGRASSLPRAAAPGAAWDCGFPLADARMQDTAEGFGQPIRQIFEPFFRIERQLPSPFDDHARAIASSSTDRVWTLLVSAARAAGPSASRHWSACSSRDASPSI